MVTAKCDLVLVGTVHGDLDGPTALKSLVEMENPGLLTVEASEAGIASFEANWTRDLEEICGWLADHGYQQFSNYLRQAEHTDGYEFRTSIAYARDHDLICELIDDPTDLDMLRRLTWSRLKEFVTQVPRHALSNVTRESTRSGHSMFYEWMKKAISGDESVRESFLKDSRGTFVGPRDSFMEVRLRDIVSKHPETKIVHVGGAMHLLDDPNGFTLYSKLVDLRPRRLLIR